MNIDNLAIENPRDLLDFLIKSGTIDTGSIQDYCDMKHKNMVLQVHKYAIAHGTGKDTRWYTRIDEKTKGGAKKKVARNTEKELYDFLFQHYFENARSMGSMTLPELYPEWFQFKSVKSVRSSTLHKIDTDYHRFYLNEPLSKPIMSIPLADIRKIDIEKWAYAVIKRHELTHKAYTNMAIVLRQMLDYLVDMEVIEGNPFLRVKIDPKAFRKVRKKPADTQIFYEDEKKAVIELAYKLAEEKNDELYYAVPLFFLTGIRIGECLALSFEDFQEDRNILHVYRSLMSEDVLNKDGTWTTRQYGVGDALKLNADPREVLVPDECFIIAEKVKQMQERKEMPYDGFLFHAKTPSNLGNKIRRLCQQLDIKIRSPHKMRKTYISELMNSGVDPDFVRVQVGHQDLQTTYNSYTYSTTRQQKQIDVLNRLLA